MAMSELFHEMGYTLAWDLRGSQEGPMADQPELEHSRIQSESRFSSRVERWTLKGRVVGINDAKGANV